MERLAGKKLLVVGVCDDRKNFVFDVAAQCGIQCCSLGPVRAELIPNKAVKFIFYDTNHDISDHQHCDTIVDLVRSEFGEVDGCVTFWDDSVPLTALLCERLGKPGIPYCGALAANQKSLALEKLKSAFVAPGRTGEQYCSLFCRVASMDDLEKNSQLVGFPAVLKRDFGSGSRSVKIIHDIDEGREHFSLLQSFQVDSDRQHYLGMRFGKECVLMELLEGSEHTVELVLFHGELVCAFIRDKGTRSDQNIVNQCINVMPSMLTLEKQAQIIRAVFECCTGLGLDHGVFNVDIMMTQSGPKLIEINARMAGLCQRDFVRLCYNVDLVHLVFLIAFDFRPELILGDSSILRVGKVLSSASYGSSSDCERDCLKLSGKDLSRVDGFKHLCFTPKPSCVIIGRSLYAWQNESALKSTLRPEVLQQLHNEGKLLFFQHERQLRMQRYESPFCTLAVTAQSFSDASRKLEGLCHQLGLQPVETSFQHQQ